MTDTLNLIETIAKEPKFSTFSRYMGITNANSVFSRPGQFTVFVPTNDAFAKIPDDQMNAMLNEPGLIKLKALLSYHIVPDRIMAANIGAKQVRNSVSGEEINFADHQDIKVNGAPIQLRNIEASNGVVHSLGTVLCPAPPAGGKPLASAAEAEPLPENAPPAAGPEVITAEMEIAPTTRPLSIVDNGNAANAIYADATKPSY